MKYITSVLILLFLLTAFQKKDIEVFICTTKSSKAYHLKKDCRGLEKCKTQIKKITKKKAENVGRAKCKLEKQNLHSF